MRVVLRLGRTTANMFAFATLVRVAVIYFHSRTQTGQEMEMKKVVLSELGRTASKRVKRLQAAIAQTADELLEKTYVGTAEQTLRGAAAMKTILHEQDGDIAKAKSAIAKKPTKKKPKRNLSKNSAVRRRGGKR
jgi:enhancing lycopene biosynthesis protein 2